MTLLIVTQKVDKNDDILGFFHDWLKEFAGKVEKLTVICLYKGEYDLPGNVRVFSLGKESGISRLKYIFNFYKYILKFRNEYDSVFVHMNTEYIILGSFIWKILNKKIGLWYAHGAVAWKLKLAEALSNIIFSSSPSGFRYQSKKIVFTGQGIDTDLFYPSESSNMNSLIRIISVGRISSIKHYERIIEAAEYLKQQNINFKISIVGKPILAKDEVYFEELKRLVIYKNLQNNINFVGSIPYFKTPEYYRNNDIFVNVSGTGSLDKAVLEAMACNLVVLTSNEAFKDILPVKYFLSKDPKEIAESIINSVNSDKVLLRDFVATSHSLSGLIRNIINGFDRKS